jgi:hypothetical protein
MKSSIGLGTLAMCAVMIISLPVTMAAQASHYKVIQIGTLGGPNSNVPLDPSVEQVLSEQGTVVGCADTAVPDPSFSNPNPAIGPDPLHSAPVPMEERGAHRSGHPRRL